MAHLQKFLLTGVSVLCLLTQTASAMNLDDDDGEDQHRARSARDTNRATASLEPERGANRDACIARLVMSATFDSEDTNRTLSLVMAALNSSVDPRKLAVIWEVLSTTLPSSAARAVDRPLASNVVIPEIARGHEDVYRRFVGGRLIYRPMEGSDEGMVVLRIADLANPLGGEFDLRNCGNEGQYLSINTGYRKRQTPVNVTKVEIWFTPRFLVDREMPSLAANHHLRAITAGGNWDAARAPVGIFLTWGGDDHMQHCDYLTSHSMDALGRENLYEKWEKSVHTLLAPHPITYYQFFATSLVVRQQTFHVSFVN